MPSRRAFSSASRWVRRITSFSRGLCGCGWNSPFETGPNLIGSSSGSALYSPVPMGYMLSHSASPCRTRRVGNPTECHYLGVRGSPSRGDAVPAPRGQDRARLTSSDPKERHPMGCLLAIFAGAFPRIALVIFWLARPDRMDAIFPSFVWPVLGIIFLPFTPLIYVLLWQFPQGVT